MGRDAEGQEGCRIAKSLFRGVNKMADLFTPVHPEQMLERALS